MQTETQLMRLPLYQPIRCAGLTDCDPARKETPTSTKKCDCKNYQLYLKEEFEKHSSTCRLFTNLKTFEYDLALEGANLKPMLELYYDWLDTTKGNIKNVENWLKLDWNTEKEETKAKVAFELLRYIEDTANTKGQKMGKGLFAQKLAYQLATNPQLEFETPQYIEDAILWVTKLNKTT